VGSQHRELILYRYQRQHCLHRKLNQPSLASWTRAAGDAWPNRKRTSPTQPGLIPVMCGGGGPLGSFSGKRFPFLLYSVVHPGLVFSTLAVFDE
jgi:hypothetical protein